MCMWKPYFDNMSIRVLEDVVMTLCFVGCRYQAPDFQMYALKTLWIPLQGKHSHKNSSGLTRYVCSFHKGDVYRKKACNQFGLS